jgi:hypothetical protein
MDGDRPDAAIPELNALPVRKEESASFTNGWNITGRFAVAKASSTSPSLRKIIKPDLPHFVM